MTIDFHTHIYPEAVAAKILPAAKRKLKVAVPGTGSPGDLCRMMKAASVAGSVLLPLAKGQEDVLDGLAGFLARQFGHLAQHLIGIARPLYANEPIGLDLKETVYAFDSTTIDLCLPVYPWAPFRSTKAAVKLHTLLDVRGSIPSFIHISDGKTYFPHIGGRICAQFRSWRG